MKKCFFIGNRHAPSEIKEEIKKAIERHIIELGVTCFIVGNYGAFDRMVQGALIEVKREHENIEIYLLTPYALTQKIEAPKGFNGTLYPNIETVPKRLAIVQGNRKIIDDCQYLIAYSHHIGNTQNFVEYAQKREKQGKISITLL